MKHIRLLILFLILGITTLSAQKSPKREFRGAWIQTVFQSEYAKMTPEEMKADFIRKLNQLQECGINAIIFQVRPEADAWYLSEIEPWSRFCTGKQGVAPDPLFDPMAFLIKECHRRNMEFHAWLNPFRAGTSGTSTLAETHVYHEHPEWFVTYNKQLLFDPGIPACRKYICRIVEDIVSRYDVDAIHMDDYFYPYPVNGMPFPDDNSFRTYGKGYKPEERDEWRRENVNKLIRELKHTIVTTKEWVRFGISPFGIYRNKKSTPDGSGSNTNGLQNYDNLYADVTLWVKKKWIDYNIPQIYWEIGHPAADYITLAEWWDKNAHDVHLYIGQDVARTMKANDLTQKMELARSLRHVKGNCFWPANEILWNNGGITDSLREHYHRSPALIPAYTHMHNGRPKKIASPRAERSEKGYTVKWFARGDREDPCNPQYFVIYRFFPGQKINLNDPAHIVAVTRYTECYIPNKKFKCRYVITAVDRFHNESKGKKIKGIR